MTCWLAGSAEAKVGGEAAQGGGVSPMVAWAIGNGATHFCHWFHPLTGLTAEKHDAFLTRDSNGGYVDTLAGSQLIQSEPDAVGNA